MQILKMILFVTLCIGYYMCIKRKTKIKEEFIPIILISGISLVIYIAGILNFLEITTWGIGIIGNIFFIKELYNIIKNKEKIEINKNIIFLLVLLIGAIIFLKNSILTHYDNFSHWGMIIKEMLLENRFPNFESTLILFTSYPPGTACTAYFVCKYLGSSEAIMLFAQALIILCSVYTLFAFCHKQNKISYIIVMLATIYLLIGNIFIDQLLVDTVLPVMGIASLAIIFYYKDESKKGLLYMIPILTLLMIVKNSGIFFIIIDYIVWLLFFIKNNGFKQIFKTKYILVIFLPILVFLLWNAHTDLVFESAAISKHSMSIENYVENFNNKESSHFSIILSKMKEKMLDITNRDNQILLIMLIIFVVTIILSRKNEKIRNDIIKLLIIYVVTYILYQISLLGMYLFSMPVNEAVNLAAYYRYFKTMVLFNYGITTVAVLNFLNCIEIENKYKKYFIKVFFVMVLALPIILFDKAEHEKVNFSPEARNIILNYKEAYNIEEEKSYLLYLSKDFLYSSDYYEYICKYDFRSTNIKVIESFKELENMDKVFDYDYFIVINADDELTDFFDIIDADENTKVIRFR